MQQCTHCGVIKDDKCFYVSNVGRVNEKKKSRCKECYNTIAREYRSKNKDLVNSKNRISYHKHKTSRRRNQRRYEQQLTELSFTDRIVYSKILLRGAKQRARESGIPCNIAYQDIPIPEFCPVLGIKIERHRGRGHTKNSASIDRIIPELGYVKGNVIVVSVKANTIKTDATPDEILMVGNFYKELAK